MLVPATPRLQPFPTKITTALMPPNANTPVTDMADMRAAQDEALNKPGWVDQQKGIVRLPIETAKQLVVQRGLAGGDAMKSAPTALTRSQTRRETVTRVLHRCVQLLLATLAAAVIAQTNSATPPQLPGKVAIDQNLNAQLPLDLMLRDETGNVVRLGQYFNHGKPVLLNFMYYRCPMLCPMVMDGVTNALTELRFDIGKEFDVVTVSIDPRDTPEQAAMKKDTVRQPLRPFRRRQRLALPHRSRERDQEAHEHRRVPVRLRHQDRPVRARRRAARGHAAGPRLALPLRLRVQAARSPPRARRSLGRKDRHRHRLHPSPLLSLRSGHRQIQPHAP